MKSAFYGAATAAVLGLALGGVLKGPFGEDMAQAQVDQVYYQTADAGASGPEAPAYAAPQYITPVAYSVSQHETSTFDDGGAAYLTRTAYLAPEAAETYFLEPSDATTAYAASPEGGFGRDAGAAAPERSESDAYAAGMTTPSVRPQSEPAPTTGPAPEQDFDSIDALIGTMKDSQADPL